MVLSTSVRPKPLMKPRRKKRTRKPKSRKARKLPKRRKSPRPAWNTQQRVPLNGPKQKSTSIMKSKLPWPTRTELSRKPLTCATNWNPTFTTCVTRLPRSLNWDLMEQTTKRMHSLNSTKTPRIGCTKMALTPPRRSMPKSLPLSRSWEAPWNSVKRKPKVALQLKPPSKTLWICTKNGSTTLRATRSTHTFRTKNGKKFTSIAMKPLLGCTK